MLTISISLPNYLIFMEGIAISKYTLASELRDFLDFKVVKFIDLFDYQEKESPEEATDEQPEPQEEDSSSERE